MKVYIGNLAPAINESDIEQMLVEVEKPASVKLIKDRYTGESRGFAFVEFTSQEKGNQAIQTLDGQNVQGKTLTANQARERREESSQNRRW